MKGLFLLGGRFEFLGNPAEESRHRQVLRADGFTLQTSNAAGGPPVPVGHCGGIVECGVGILLLGVESRKEIGDGDVHGAPRLAVPAPVQAMVSWFFKTAQARRTASCSGGVRGWKLAI